MLFEIAYLEFNRGSLMKHSLVIFSAAAALAVLCGCATSSKSASRPASRTPAGSDKISIAMEQDARLGSIVRHVGEQSAVGIVLMQGLEWFDLGAIEFTNASLPEVTKTLAAKFEGRVQASPAYHFIFPAGYEALEEVTVEGKLAPELAEQRVSIAMGGGTPLYTVLAVLSKTLNVTLVADNAIAASECGELALPELPLSTVLEAVLKSARIPNEAFVIAGGSDHALICRAGADDAGPWLLNADGIGDAERAMLGERVSFELPHPQSIGDSITIFPGASPLHEVLPSLSQQLGVRVTAEDALAGLPVNPMVVHDLPRSVAIELLIRQWLVPRYGYTVEGGSIVLREKPEA